MNKEFVAIPLLLLLLSGFVGVSSWALYLVQHVADAKWSSLASYLLILPIIKTVTLLPGILVGYFYGAGRLLLIFVFGCLAYIPYQTAAKMVFDLSVPTTIAHSLAYSITTVVAAMAGAYLSQRRFFSNKSSQEHDSNAVGSA